MTTQDVLTFVSLAGAGFATFLSMWGQRRMAKMQAEIEERRHARDKAEEAEAIISRFREPLLHSAFELQSRLFNVLRKDFLGKFYVRGTDREKAYVVDSTAFVVAQYLGWTEVTRREVQFLDMGEMENTRRLAEIQEAIRQLFLLHELGPVLRIFRSDQRAIGELMMVQGPSGPQCMGYAAFVRNEDPTFQHWVGELKKDIAGLHGTLGEATPRLERLQRALIDLVDFLDPDCVRFPREIRGKV
jgi:hypothetical protein